MSLVQKAFLGVRLLSEGWQQIRQQPRLWIGILIPWMINISIIVLGWTSGVTWIKTSLFAIIAKFVGTEGFLFNVLYYPALIVFGLGFMAAILFFSLAISTVIAAPFYSWLAETTLIQSGEILPNPSSLIERIRFVLKMFLVGLAKGVVFGAIGFCLFILSFIPVVNFVAAFLTMCLLSADIMDYSLEARGMVFSKRVQFFSQRIMDVAGTSLLLSLTSLVPGLTVLLLPIFVIGMAKHLANLRASS